MIVPLIIVGVGVAAALARRSSSSSSGLSSFASQFSGMLRETAGPKGSTNKGQVFHYERAKGLHPDVRAFVEWWAESGAFPVTILDGGALRTAAQQAQFFREGNSDAATLDQSAHGRAAAVDLVPAVIVSNYVDKTIWDDYSKFEEIGRQAKARGLEWGGDFPKVKKGAKYDGPHVQVANWRSLPYPAPLYA